MPLFETAHNLEIDRDLIRQRAYGIIEVKAGRLKAIRFRPWPKWVSLLEIVTLGRRYHHRRAGDYFRLYYNQPMGHRNYLSLQYVLSTRQSSMKSLRAALATLDEVARIKRCDAILCQLTNGRLSDRCLRRFGFEEHLPHRSGRHYIRRFYGNYPEPKQEGRSLRSRPSTGGLRVSQSHPDR